MSSRRTTFLASTTITHRSSFKVAPPIERIVNYKERTESKPWFANSILTGRSWTKKASRSGNSMSSGCRRASDPTGYTSALKPFYPHGTAINPIVDLLSDSFVRSQLVHRGEKTLRGHPHSCLCSEYSPYGVHSKERDFADKLDTCSNVYLGEATDGYRQCNDKGSY